MKYNNIKRLVHRVTEEIGATLKITKNTSVLNFNKIIVAKMINYKLNQSGAKASKEDIECLMNKHCIVMEYFEKRYGDYARTYEFDENSIPKTSCYKNKVWICWWQGIDNAPDVVQKCVGSICASVAPYEVIILDDTNYKKYVNIPEWMEEKRYHNANTFFRLFKTGTVSGTWWDLVGFNIFCM